MPSPSFRERQRQGIRDHPDWAANRIACEIGLPYDAENIDYQRSLMEDRGELLIYRKLLGRDGKWHPRHKKQDHEATRQEAARMRTAMGKVNKSEIARLLRVDRTTVRKVLKDHA